MRVRVRVWWVRVRVGLRVVVREEWAWTFAARRGVRMRVGGGGSVAAVVGRVALALRGGVARLCEFIVPGCGGDGGLVGGGVREHELSVWVRLDALALE